MTVACIGCLAICSWIWPKPNLADWGLSCLFWVLLRAHCHKIGKSCRTGTRIRAPKRASSRSWWKSWVLHGCPWWCANHYPKTKHQSWKYAAAGMAWKALATVEAQPQEGLPAQHKHVSMQLLQVQWNLLVRRLMLKQLLMPDDCQVSFEVTNPAEPDGSNLILCDGRTWVLNKQQRLQWQQDASYALKLHTSAILCVENKPCRHRLAMPIARASGTHQ